MLFRSGASYQTGSSFSNLPGGNYSIVILDGNGCIATSSALISEPTALSLNTLASSSTCGNSNGSIQTLASGGAAPYQYSINNGSNFQSSGTFSNIAQGNYTVLISDANGCTTTSPITVNNLAGPVVQNSTSTNITCSGFNDGSISLSTQGGTLPITYVLNGGGTSQSIGYFNGLSTGAYTVTATDANGCSVNTTATIT